MTVSTLRHRTSTQTMSAGRALSCSAGSRRAWRARGASAHTLAGVEQREADLARRFDIGVKDRLARARDQLELADPGIRHEPHKPVGTERVAVSPPCRRVRASVCTPLLCARSMLPARATCCLHVQHAACTCDMLPARAACCLHVRHAACGARTAACPDSESSENCIVIGMQAPSQLVPSLPGITTSQLRISCVPSGVWQQERFGDEPLRMVLAPSGVWQQERFGDEPLRMVLAPSLALHLPQTIPCVRAVPAVSHRLPAWERRWERVGQGQPALWPTCHLVVCQEARHQLRSRRLTVKLAPDAHELCAPIAEHRVPRALRAFRCVLARRPGSPCSACGRCSRRLRDVLVVRADDAGGAERGAAGAGAVRCRRRLRSNWLEVLRALGSMAVEERRLPPAAGRNFALIWAIWTGTLCLFR
jgi:hypothetical protein